MEMTETLSWQQLPIPVPPLYSGCPAPLSSPREVLANEELSAAEKRSILAFWASDACAVESKPWLRQPPGMTRPIGYQQIMEALYQLDCLDCSRPANDNLFQLGPTPSKRPAVIATRSTTREPTLDEALADPIVQALMRRDGVSEPEIRALGRRFRPGQNSRNPGTPAQMPI
jgi:hypothetical protein